jgi:hypothetical protein
MRDHSQGQAGPGSAVRAAPATVGAQVVTVAIDDRLIENLHVGGRA